MATQFTEPEQDVTARLREHGQDHVLRWVNELSDEDRAALMAQLADVNLGEVRGFTRMINTPPTDFTFADIRPARVERLPLREPHMQAERQVVAAGRAALEADRVAVVAVAGGQGTRLRYDHPKGMYPVSPIRHKTLFELFAEQILAGRRRYGCRMPWLIMTSPTNDEETRAYFADNDYLGLGADTVHFFPQEVNPILDARGRLLLAEKGRLLVGPNGHGGTFAALERADLLTMLRGEGHDLISYFQVDNPLVTVVDARFIGHHLRKGADFSCKVVPKRNPEEGLGIAVVKGGKPAVVEYVDVPAEVAAERSPSGQLRYRFGSIAIHIIGIPFAERVRQHPEGLPWHVAHKQYEIVGDDGETALSAPKSCFKFERFIFEALAFADRCAFVEVRRDTEFAPVKNAEGADTPDIARRMMQRDWLNWLRQAGADFEMPRDLSGPVIEISPLYAADAEELKEKFKPDGPIEFPLLLAP